MSRTRRLGAAALALTLVTAACGGDDDDAVTTDPPAATEPTSTEPATTEPATTEPATTEPVATVPAETAPETTEAAPETTEAAPVLGSIVDVATEAGEFTTLLAAAEAAGLTEELSTRDVTLLAPTDEAFAALGQETIDALLADPATLAGILQGHVLAVPQTSDSIVYFDNLLAINGASWDVVVEGDQVRIGEATVVMADIEADNGIIHVIDAVLVPPPAAG